VTTPSFTSEAAETTEVIEQPPPVSPIGRKRPAPLTLGLAVVTVLLLAAVGVLSGALVGASHHADDAVAAVVAAKQAAATASASASAQLQQAQATASAAAARASTAEAAQSAAEQAAQAAQSESAGSPDDRKFLAALAAGAPDLRAAAPGSQLIAAAHASCKLLGSQILSSSEARTLAVSAVEGQGWTAAESATLVNAAISAYCPSNGN